MELRTRGLRLLAALLVVLWTALAVAILVAYRPGGPADAIVAMTAFVPAIIAGAAVVWPPTASGYRVTVAIAWLGLCSALLVGGLLLIVAKSLAGGGRQTLLPSLEVGYAGLLALGTSSLFAGLGLARIVSRDGGVTARRLAIGGGSATILTLVGAGAFGGAAIANERALRDAAPPSSAFGPTDPALTPPECDSGLAVGSTARVDVSAEAFIDLESIGTAAVAGVRRGGDERWEGRMTSRFGSGVAAFVRVGDEAQLALDGSPPTRVPPNVLQMTDPMGGTLDSAVAAAIEGPSGEPVAQDLGVELIEGAKARHCRIAIDGPTALRTFVPVRWLASGEVMPSTVSLKEWRGSLDWWVFGDGELGMATLILGGLPIDAWPVQAVQGSLRARLTAVDRGSPVVVQRP